MDVKISGSGRISAGIYEDIKISGSAKLDSPIKCKSLTCSGALHANGDIESCSIKISGSARIDGRCHAEDEVKISGSLKCADVKGSKIKISGSAVLASCEGEEVKISGSVECRGLINAEELTIELYGKCELGSIGGSTINVIRADAGNSFCRLSLFNSISKRAKSNSLDVKESIEGDSIALENTHCPLVIGRVVAIGEGCDIDVVQYSEDIEISPKAKVSRCEKI